MGDLNNEVWPFFTSGSEFDREVWQSFTSRSKVEPGGVAKFYLKV
jgi:hypothetical protein